MWKNVFKYALMGVTLLVSRVDSQTCGLQQLGCNSCNDISFGTCTSNPSYFNFNADTLYLNTASCSGSGFSCASFGSCYTSTMTIDGVCGGVAQGFGANACCNLCCG